MSLAIFFSFLGDKNRGRCDSHESHLPLFGTIYFPIAPSLLGVIIVCWTTAFFLLPSSGRFNLIYC